MSWKCERMVGAYRVIRRYAITVLVGIFVNSHGYAGLWVFSMLDCRLAR